jgi:hypothetical protein
VSSSLRYLWLLFSCLLFAKMFDSKYSLLGLSFCLQLAHGQTSATASSWSTKVYNVSAATTTLTYQYTNEELAMLWNQVGSIAVGPITTTVEPTPEPTAYPRPGPYHPLVCQSSILYKEVTNIFRSQPTIPRSITHLSQTILFGV